MAIETTRKDAFPVGAELYTLCTEVSASGVTRTVRVFRVVDGDIVECTWHVADALGKGDAYKKRGGRMRISGVGLDVGHHVIDAFSRALHGRGDAFTHRRL